MPNSAMALVSVSNSRAFVRSVRRARRAGDVCWLRNTVSVSWAASTACFRLAWMGDDTEQLGDAVGEGGAHGRHPASSGITAAPPTFW